MEHSDLSCVGGMRRSESEVVQRERDTAKLSVSEKPTVSPGRDSARNDEGHSALFGRS